MSGVNSTNETTCYDFDQVPKPALAVHSSLIALIIFATLLGNGLILVLVARYKVLRSRSVIANLSLTFSDLLWCLCYHTPALVSSSRAGWAFGDTACTAFGILSIEFLLTRWFVMSVVCVDRFSTVRFPFSYTKYSKCILAVLITMAWILPFILASLPEISNLADCEFRPNIPTCLFSCDNRLCRFYYGVVVSLSFVLGAVIPTILYVWLYRRARSLRPAAVVLGQMALQPATGAATGHHLPYSYPDKHSRDIHGYITFILILVTFMVTAAPAYLAQILRSSNYYVWCRIPIYVHFGIQLIFFSSTALDPLVIMRDRDFQKCLKHMLYCRQAIDLYPDNQAYTAQWRPSLDILSMTTHDTQDVESRTTPSYSTCTGHHTSHL